ncbi:MULTISPECIES: DUF2799 domain-containing protein [Methylomonas]|uniref:DUF2799 domain-containing protein n=2 Tax=Methylomonas TaxID=416 RepID=A0A140E713_9GAMM|nr:MULTISPECIES: DUF2799 domain-containing protein [Methylomonas]AMK79187.1 hypothetical protein JT25_022335 [Methylomonas denitrificans]OAH98179.1 hypothetical protein A1342_00485 [Methylomonas methanica]TCV86295.1 uncharacterized protein DUF2799 [Methylomonas methanica]
MKCLTWCLLAVSLSGCATLSQQDCLRGDWFGVGVQDGRSGATADLLHDHQKACSEYGIAVNNSQYFAGREQGINEYCRIENAFNEGLAGHDYRHVCPPAIDGVFSRYHAAAYAVHQGRAELDRIDSDLFSKEGNLGDKKLSDKDRARIREDIRHLERSRDRVRDDLYFHERRLNEFRYESQSYR